MSNKIIIIGGGPVGCYTAQLLKIYGYSPLVVEEHHEIGRPIHCTGLIGKRVFDEKRPFVIPANSIINRINGATIHYDNQNFSIERKNVAFVIDRERFDKDLSKGLDILYGRKFIGIEKSKSGYIIETDQDQLFADTIIGADGANSTVRKFLNPDSEIKCNKGVQLRIRVRSARKDLVEVYLKKSLFFWMVPESEDVMRIGTISENPYRDLQDFLKEEKIKGEIIERFGGLVAIGICKNTVKDNIALVGDAACQLKPLSYGGVYFGLKAASILASCIKENRILEYDALWKKELLTEIKIGLKARQIYNELEQEELKKIFKLLKNQKSLIEKIGDFENHSRLILEILKKPNIYPQIGDLFYLLIKKILA